MKKLKGIIGITLTMIHLITMKKETLISIKIIEI